MVTYHPLTNRDDTMSSKKNSLPYILDHVDVPEFIMCAMMAGVAAVACFIALSYLTSSPLFSQIAGGLTGLVVLYLVLRYTANLPPRQNTGN